MAKRKGPTGWGNVLVVALVVAALLALLILGAYGALSRWPAG